MLDDTHPARDFHSLVKPAIDNLMGCEVTFDILFHNSEHQATLLRYGVKKSAQVSRATSSCRSVEKPPALNTMCLCVTDREDL